MHESAVYFHNVVVASGEMEPPKKIAIFGRKIILRGRRERPQRNVLAPPRAWSGYHLEGEKKSICKLVARMTSLTAQER